MLGRTWGLGVRAGEGLQDAVGDTAGVAALQLDVVVGADTGQQRDLLAPQTGHPTISAVDGQTGLPGGDSGAAGGEEVAELGAGVHTRDGTSVPARVRGPGSTCNGRNPLVGGHLR